MRKAIRALALLACLGILGLGGLAKADDASAACGHWHVDPLSTYTGPVPVGLFCSHQGNPQYTWTVPDEVTAAHFSVSGGDDPVGETTGGHVEARLDLVPGSELTMEMGGEGEATVVRLGEEPLVVAAGGSEAESNFVIPSATEVEIEEPGAPQEEPFTNGRIDVEWTYWFEGEDPPVERLAGAAILPSPPTASCAVPRLKGLRPVAARKALALANCRLGRITRRPARRGQRGRVLRQTPATGAAFPSGTAVDLVVGRRP